MPTKKLSTKSRRQRLFDIGTLLNGLKDAVFVEMGGDAGDFHEGDMVLVDRQRSPRKGDYVVRDDGEGRLDVVEFSDWRTFRFSTAEGSILGVVVSLIRDFRKLPKRKSPATQNRRINRRVSRLRGELAKLERVPENEAERFKLETEIYRAEREQDLEEWPEVIAA